MDGLPRDLLDNILFRVDLRALAMMRCTNKSFQSHIHDPYFESEYSSRLGSYLIHISRYCSRNRSVKPDGNSRSFKIKDALRESLILGCCSGLLLLFIDDRLCVANPFTKKFRFFNQSTFMRFTGVLSRHNVDRRKNKKQIGFAVDQIDGTTQSFKIVHVFDMGNHNETMYRFEINAGKSWKRSKTKLTCDASDLMKSPVYFDGTLYCLRNDGSIVAFNLETEQARLIPIKFPQGFGLKTLLAVGDNSLTLISATEEVIYVYALENIFSDPKWVLVMQIPNRVMDVNRLSYWNIEAYDGRRLVLREDREKQEGGRCYDRVVHMYDLSANKWVIMVLYPVFSDANQKNFLFTPSPSSVVGLDEIWVSGVRHLTSLNLIMELVYGSSSKKVEQQLRKRSVQHNEQSTNKKRRVV